MSIYINLKINQYNLPSSLESDSPNKLSIKFLVFLFRGVSNSSDDSKLI